MFTYRGKFQGQTNRGKLLEMIKNIGTHSIGRSLVGLVIGCAACNNSCFCQVDSCQISLCEELTQVLDVGTVDIAADDNLDDLVRKLSGELSCGYHFHALCTVSCLWNLAQHAPFVVRIKGKVLAYTGGDAEVPAIGSIL